MVKVRLARHGKKNDPYYRIVAIDERRAVVGKTLDTLGFWHPAKDDKKIDKKALDLWIKKGAQVSPAVMKLIAK